MKIKKKLTPQDNDLFLIDLNNSIHSQILLNTNLRVFVLRDC